LTAGDGVTPTDDPFRSTAWTTAPTPISPNGVGIGIVDHREHLNEHQHDHPGVDDAHQPL